MSTVRGFLSGDGLDITSPPRQSLTAFTPTMPKSRIFRQSSFERLSSPDQLDQLVPVTTAKGWIALTGVAALLGGVVFWGVFGSVPSKVTASGIIVGPRGIHAVRARGAGQVGAVMLKVGDTVRVGELAA